MMKAKLLAIILAIAVVVSMVGCAVQPAANLPQQQPGGAQSQNSQEQPPADRYAEVIDTPEGKFTIYFFQLDFHSSDTDKSGDCSLLISPDGQTMLIDSGNVSCGNQVLGYLKDLGISKIDHLVVSHPHIDHIGCIVQIAKEHQIGMHYRTELEYVTNTYVDYKAYFEKHDIPTTYLQEGDEIQFGEHVRVRVLNPPDEIEYPKDYPDRSTQFVNNTSLALRFDYGESTYLSCGDLYQGREKELLEKYPELVDVDIAKANHHGLDTSNSIRWVKAVSPKYVVAMSDDISSMSIYERFKNNEALYYNTSYDGVVRISMDDQKNYEVVTQHDSWLRD